MLGGDGLTFPQLRGWRASVDGSVEMADFRALYDHFYPLVWRWVARVGVPGDAREDVVQEVFLTIYGKLDTFEARSSMKTWVLAITVRVTQGYRRRRRTGPTGDGCEVDALPDRIAHPEAAAQQNEALGFLQQVLNELDDEKREVFILAELEQLSMNEIATLLAISSNTVASRLRLAREEVREAWERAKARDQWRLR